MTALETIAAIRALLAGFDEPQVVIIRRMLDQLEMIRRSQA